MKLGSDGYFVAAFYLPKPNLQHNLAYTSHKSTTGVNTNRCSFSKDMRGFANYYFTAYISGARSMHCFLVRVLVSYLTAPSRDTRKTGVIPI
jgi:hypothetical protein